MGVIINHLISAIIAPVTVSFLGLVVGLIFLWRNWRRTGWSITLAAFGWLYICSTSLIPYFVGYPLEQLYPPVQIEALPQADAIVLLSGGMGGSTNVWQYGEMWTSADRVWHAGRIWKAGKAPIVLTTGKENDNSTISLLTGLGVDEKAIIAERDSLNTEENAKFTERTLKARVPGKAKYKVLLVTSAWHMRRSVLMFSKYTPDIEVIPAAADYEFSQHGVWMKWYDLFWPSADSLVQTGYILKEVVGYWGYKLRGW